MKKPAQLAAVKRSPLGEPAHPDAPSDPDFAFWQSAQVNSRDSSQCEDRMPSGWWLMPMVLIGLLFWAMLGWLILG